MKRHKWERIGEPILNRGYLTKCLDCKFWFWSSAPNTEEMLKRIETNCDTVIASQMVERLTRPSHV